MAKTKLIVGLGNIGQEYEGTRHNIGFMLIDAVASLLDKNSKKDFEFSKKCNSEMAEGTWDDKKIVLAKPHTFVNVSGEAVKKLKALYKVKSEDIIIVHDELDIEFGHFKLSFGKDSGGHRGVQSVIDSLKTNKFWRLRVGTSSRILARARHESNLTAKKEAVTHFVLSKFTPSEREELKMLFKKALERLFLAVKQ